MPFYVEHLLGERGQPVCVGPQDTVRMALDLMFEYDYSQLPVIDENRRPLGMIHHESIVRAHSSFGLSVDQLVVADAMDGIGTLDLYKPDYDLFDMLNRLRDSNAVLIVDGDGLLTDIVTSYDVMVYFRRHFEDTMFVEDIEEAVKAHIQAAFTDPACDRIDEAALSSTIQEVTSTGRALRGRFEKALSAYLAQQGSGDKPDPAWVNAAFSVFEEKAVPKPLEQLPLHDYIQLLLHPGRSEYCSRVLPLDPNALRKLLYDVRDTRNELFHFRGEITAAQRERLRFCSAWFERHPVAEKEAPALVTTMEISSTSEPAAGQPPLPTDEEIVPSEEMPPASYSRYAPIGAWLNGLAEDRIRVTFEQIRKIIDGPLPGSAHQHRAWWANDSTHVQAQQWLDAGWRVSTVNMADEEVVFLRTGERQKAYMRFFGDLLRQFAPPVAPFPPKKGKFLQGASWHMVRGLPDGGPQRAILCFSFAHYKRFRVELYIDGGDRERNKKAFDLVYAQKEQIEAAAGMLAWERMDDKRASRVALYHGGTITDGPESLAKLRTWAVEAMVRFYQAIHEPANQALKSAWNIG